MRHFLMAAVLVATFHDTPEQTLKKIEEKVTTAKSARLVSEGVAVQMKDGKESDRRTFTSTVLIKGNKIRANNALVDPKAPKDPETTVFRCDGKKFNVVDDGQPGEPTDAWATLGTEIGAAVALSILGATNEIPAQQERIKEWLPKASDVKSGGKDGDWETLTYKIMIAGSKGAVKVWYDAKTLRVAKRTFEVVEGGGTILFSETIKEWAFDVEIADSEFELPAPGMK